jgi:hypothetical protein
MRHQALVSHVKPMDDERSWGAMRQQALVSHMKPMDDERSSTDSFIGMP